MGRLFLCATLIAATAAAQERSPKWVVLFDSPAIARRVVSRQGLQTAAAASAQRELSVEHDRARAAIAQRGASVTGESQILLNAVFFRGSAEDAASLRDLPGVRAVVRMRGYRPLADDQATNLMNAPAAWTALGGVGSAGLNRRIGILDSGVDQTHPAFQDDSLTPPDGFPKANGDNLAYTSKKVIVARSYVDMLVDPTHPDNSRPDDLSARDRGGHGTALAMLAAGRSVTGPAATVTGIAPKAFIGSYKVFGSPGVNDLTYADVIIAALQDAITDGMDVVTLSLGSPADFGAVDTCGSGDCDPIAMAVNNAVFLGLSVVAAAGDDGDIGANLPTLGSINTPGTAPDAITVGSTTNGQNYFQSLSLPGNNIPVPLQRVNGRFGNGPVPATPLTAKLTDVKTLNNDGLACKPLGDGTLTGQIAIVDRGGNCSRADKVNYAQQSGAVAVVLVNFSGVNTGPPFSSMEGTGIPMFAIGGNDGATLRTYLQSNPNAQGTLDPAIRQFGSTPDQIAYFSSRGPAITDPTYSDYGLKPELTAVGSDLYVAAQNYDPNGSVYSKDRYLPTQGTSLSAALVAGAVALVKQKTPGLDSYKLKSAVVNSANPAVDDFDASGNKFQARVTATGAGKLDVAKAVNQGVTVEPAVISFGVFRGTTIAGNLQFRNITNAALQVSLAVQQRDADSIARVEITSSPTFTIAPGALMPVGVRLIGGRPQAGSYEGIILATVGGTTLRIPYLYLAGDGVPFNIYALRGTNFVAPPGTEFPFDNATLSGYFEVKVLDRFGVPVANQNVAWSVAAGGGSITRANLTTDGYGIATAGAIVGPTLGEQALRITAGTVSTVISGRATLAPSIDDGGIVNAASFKAGQGQAPGSYISIFGAGLSDVTREFSTPYLPLSLSNVSVSFDLPSKGLSYPGRLHFAKNNQVNVQVPWEFSGQTEAQVKVSIGALSTPVITVPLNNFSPGFFEYDDASSGRRIAVGQDEAYKVVSGANAVSRGGVIQLYVNGLGQVTNPPKSGEPALANPLSETLTRPVVTIGGRPAQVEFSGLAPTLIGTYQVNVRVPSDAPTGVQPITMSIGGIDAAGSVLPIR